MAAPLSLTTMRAVRTCTLAASLVLAAPGSARAQADSCLDASDRARAELAQKHLLLARAQLRLCAASSCDESVRSICDERLAEVTARLPTIIFDAKDADGRDLPVVRLVIDGVLRSEGPLDEEIALDPGAHTFVFEAPGLPAVERSFVLVEREKARREHVAFGAPKPPEPPPPRAVPPSPPSALRTAGWITIGGGAVGVGIGSAFGVLAIVKNGDAGCDAANVCNDPRSRHDARVAANVSTVAFVAGAALVGGGIALVLLGKPATVAAAPGGIAVAGRF